MSSFAVWSLAVWLSAAPTKVEPVRVALPGLRGLGAIEQKSEFLNEHLALQLKREGFEVVTRQDLQSLLGLERQKALLGCSEAATSCTAEIVAALGSDGLVLGDVGQLGDRLQVNLKVLSSTGKSIAVFGAEARNEGDLLDVLSRAARSLREQVALALGREITPLAEPAASGPGPWWIPGVVGVIGAGVGTALLLAGNGKAETLRTQGATLSDVQAQMAVNEGKGLQTTGVVVMAVGGAAVAASVLWLIAGSSGPKVAVVPTSEGAVFAVGGSF